MSSKKSILITGSSSGFGLLTVETLAKAGHTVFASMREVCGKNLEVATQLKEWGETENLNLHLLELDVTDNESVEKAISHIVETTGQIDVVVNNAGVGTFGMTETFTVDQAQSLFDVNVMGILRVNRAVLPHMRDQRSGLLIFVSSVLGRVIFPFVGVYSASKWAVEALAETSRYELAPLGIDSVIVEPGAYRTGFGPNMVQAGDQNRFVEYGPVAEMAHNFASGLMERVEKSMADPQEVADTIAQLINTPAGQRPLRTLVGENVEIGEVINQTSEQMQGQILQMMGMQNMLNVSVPEKELA